jgi:hypothetical protein
VQWIAHLLAQSFYTELDTMPLPVFLKLSQVLRTFLCHLIFVHLVLVVPDGSAHL